ncbi:MAG: ABC transporter ATP-binding protein [Propionibacteriaceae bacterium]
MTSETRDQTTANTARLLLSVEDAMVRYPLPGGGRFTAVTGVSFEVGAGEVLGLVGESGCGKSTLARAICGLEKLDEGTIWFGGESVRPLGYRRRPERQLRIQMVFQNPYASLNPRRTVAAQLADGLRINPDPQRWNVSSLLEAVELTPDAAKRYPHSFSGGQRQRIAIARAIAAGPDLLIGDEPIASLDASLQARIAQLMKDLALETGASLLFISHDLAVVRVVADRVAVMNAGALVELGRIDEVWDNPQQDYTKRLLAAIPMVDGLGVIPGAPQSS